MEKTEEKSRLTVDLFLSSDDSAELRWALLMLLSKVSIDLSVRLYYNRMFIEQDIAQLIKDQYQIYQKDNRYLDVLWVIV